MSGEVVVLKFGSSILESWSDVPSAVHEIYGWYRGGHRVIAVVSAIGRTTNSLIAQAAELSPSPEPYALAELLATGERNAAALLGIALDRAGIPARVVDPREIHLTAQGKPLDSEPTLVAQSKLQELLAATPVLVVPGFFGHDAQGRLHLLGRGGSDLTAAFLASVTQAKRCRLIKDVDGVYDCDPAMTLDAPAHRYATLDYETAIRVAAPLIQPKAVRFLERHQATAEVAGLTERYETLVGPHDVALEPRHSHPPTSVLLLGLGTVGFGVYRRLRALNQHFQVIGALCLNPLKHEQDGMPHQVLHGPDSQITLLAPDVVVDALPGFEPSRAIVRHFLERGVSVVSANKRLIADAASELEHAAERSHAVLKYSAAVGGSAPMIEAVRRLAHRGEIRSLEGILNGTCNYLLDRCAAGLALEEAVEEAQAKGFAETNPTDDLIGSDAARKLRILARHAFGRELIAIDMRPLTTESLAKAQRELRNGQVLRVVSRAIIEQGRLLGEVSLRALDADHPLASVSGEWNRLIVTPHQGPSTTVSGRGAGRWPTTEAVIADLLEIRHQGAHAPAQAALRTADRTQGADFTP
jgi:homoserine dehydrogenase